MTSNEILDLYNDLARRYPDFYKRSGRMARSSLWATTLASKTLMQRMELIKSLPIGPERMAQERCASDDEGWFLNCAEILRERLEMMTPPSTDLAAIEREILDVFKVTTRPNVTPAIV